MSIQFNADEILAVAEQIERNGETFYRSLAQRQADRSAAVVLVRLADMEQEHLRVFSGMRAGLSEEERKPVTFDPYDEGSLYLRVMADRSVFSPAADLSRKLSGQETADQALQMGIQAEKDSIVFYTGLKDVVPARLGRDRIEAIIREELGHLATLSEMLADLR